MSAANRPPLIREYAGWSEFFGEARLAPWSDVAARDEWRGGVTRDEATALAERGWPEGMQHVKDVLPIVHAQASRLVQASGWLWDVAGAAYDVGALLGGEPEHWLAPVTEEQRSVVTVAVDVATSSGVPAHVITLRGAGVVALTLALRAAGYVVDVTMVYGGRPYARGSSSSDGRDVWLRTALTDAAGGPLDADRLMYALAHPSAARGFAYSLGSVLAGYPATTYIAWPLSPCPWTADVFLRGAHISDADWQDRAACERWVERTIEAITGGTAT